MRRLEYSIDLGHFREIKKDVVPVIFTEHQFRLIEKKFSNKKMNATEKNEFSRTISRKMKAINRIFEKEAVFIYGKEKIIKERLEKARGYINKFSRKFKDKHIIISGSFLHNKKYNDIDIFIISKYDKNDYNTGKFHINYLTEDVYNSLFFGSLKRLCISNKKIESYEVMEEISIDTFISLYQEVFNDIDKKYNGVKETLRNFILQSAFIKKASIPDSCEIMQQVSGILSKKKPKELLKNIFIETVVIGIDRKKAIREMKKMIKKYKETMKEYRQHKKYYLDLMQAFKDVISIEG